jgi:HSP20 family protein
MLPTTERRGALRSPAGSFLSLQREIDNLFNEFTRDWPSLKGTTSELAPHMDVVEKDSHVEITVELPGIEEKDVEVSLTDDILTIHGEKKAEKEEKTENRYLVERSYGAFSRSIQVPPGTKPDDIKASMAKGVLTVTLPKTAKAQPEAKKIEVKTA